MRRNWNVIFIVLLIAVFAFFFNFNSAKKIYIKGDKYYVSKFLDFLNKNGLRYTLVDEENASFIIDLDNLEVVNNDGLKFNIRYSDELINKVLKKLFEDDCKYLILNNNFYRENAYFYKHFTFETTCGITVMVLPVEYGGLEIFVFRTILNIINRNYVSFENGYLVTSMNLYKVSRERKLIGIYDPILDTMEIIADEKN
ncbi:hypothetical protein AS157_00640 [Thermosipho sp. 1244]|nr:hypothetical protein [Thermosipho sp. 1244]